MTSFDIHISHFRRLSAQHIEPVELNRLIINHLVISMHVQPCFLLSHFLFPPFPQDHSVILQLWS